MTLAFTTCVHRGVAIHDRGRLTVDEEMEVRVGIRAIHNDSALIIILSEGFPTPTALHRLSQTLGPFSDWSIERRAAPNKENKDENHGDTRS